MKGEVTPDDPHFDLIAGSQAAVSVISHGPFTKMSPLIATILPAGLSLSPPLCIRL